MLITAISPAKSGDIVSADELSSIGKVLESKSCTFACAVARCEQVMMGNQVSAIPSSESIATGRQLDAAAGWLQLTFIASRPQSRRRSRSRALRPPKSRAMCNGHRTARARSPVISPRSMRARNKPARHHRKSSPRPDRWLQRAADCRPRVAQFLSAVRAA